MRTKKFSKLAVFATTGGLLLGGGCSIDSLLSNIWKGFGQSLGAVPANLLLDLNPFGLFDTTTDDTTE